MCRVKKREKGEKQVAKVVANHSASMPASRAHSLATSCPRWQQGDTHLPSNPYLLLMPPPTHLLGCWFVLVEGQHTKGDDGPEPLGCAALRLNTCTCTCMQRSNDNNTTSSPQRTQLTCKHSITNKHAHAYTDASMSTEVGVFN